VRGGALRPDRVHDHLAVLRAFQTFQREFIAHTKSVQARQAGD
jgi:hypothetical protein